MCYKLIIKVGTCNAKHVNTLGLPYHALRFPNKICSSCKKNELWKYESQYIFRFSHKNYNDRGEDND